MKNRQSGNSWFWVIVVVAVVAYGLWALYHNPAPAVVTSNTNQEVTPTEDTSVGSIDAGAGAASISYQNALIKYKDARLQIEQNCQASPDKMTFKNNAFMMIDNRSVAPHTVKVGVAYPIKSYGFKIIQLSSKTLPATWLVDCDQSQNVSTISIQK